jgi:hypothetical protein
MNRRQFQQALVAGGTAALLPGVANSAAPAPRGRAEACIFLWLGGGMCHLDTFDPKRRGDPLLRKPGSAYAAIPTAIEGARVCEHLPRTAAILDRGVILRSVHHDMPDEHARPTNLFKTGRPTSDTIVYPSIGSIVSHERGPAAEGVPPYVVIGYPNVTRGPGFLGARYGYLYLTDTEAGPTGLHPPSDVGAARQTRRRVLLDDLRNRQREQHEGDTAWVDYDAAIEQSLRLGGPEFGRAFELSREPASLRNRYGDEFGQRCLLARRLVQAGVRWVEVSFNLNFINGTGWDTHAHGQREQHRLIASLDVGLSALVADLERQKLLDSTLVVVATEFGRPAHFDGQGGRGHQSSAFSTVLFGGGLRSGQAIGATDDLGKQPISTPISVPDWHATIHTALKIDPAKDLYAGDRPVPITDHGRPLATLFA